ncbi:MAG: iron-containing alcohol dehydrogenase [Anaerolineae bacterium]|nr:iron-containing alcohol dehydrogenase [Anaerolineae bacterium]
MVSEFMTSPRIVYGVGALAQIGTIAASMSRSGKILVVTGSDPARAEPLLGHLRAAGLTPVVFPTQGEPKVETAEEGVRMVRAEACDLVIGYGGGSPIDAGKAIAALATNPGEPLDYLEVIGKAQPLEQPPLPYIAVPTTAGTGSEVTRNAVLASEEKKVKVSVRSPLMIPRVALIDPELAQSLPPSVTASAGMDALTQVIEPFTSSKATPMTDALARDGIVRAARSLRRAYEHPDDLDARSDMALAALYSGISLANAALGAVHGFAGPLGGMYPIPHGVICARLLPIVMEANLKALRERASDHPALARYGEIARIVTGRDDAAADDGIAWTYELRDALAIPGLGEFGLKADHFADVLPKAQRASSMKGNPLLLTEDELLGILAQAI